LELFLATKCVIVADGGIEETVVNNDDRNQVENHEESLAGQALGVGNARKMLPIFLVRRPKHTSYNRTIQKADASFLATSPGSKIVYLLIPPVLTKAQQRKSLKISRGSETTLCSSLAL
jgi:hypothetical protein